jgi:hypothetical protein
MKKGIFQTVTPNLKSKGISQDGGFFPLPSGKGAGGMGESSFLNLDVSVGSLIFVVKKVAFWGVGARKRAHTPKCGGLSQEFLKNLSVIKIQSLNLRYNSAIEF